MRTATSWSGGTPFEPFGDGYVIPSRYEIRITEWLYDVQLDVRFEHGRFIVTDLHVTRVDEPVTSEGLRRVPIRRFIASSAEQVLHTRTVTQSGGPDTAVHTVAPARLPADLARVRLSAEALGQAAVVYRIAHAVGLPPTQTVSQRFKLPRSTAGRWITEARRRGLLGPAEERKAGETDGEHRETS